MNPRNITATGKGGAQYLFEHHMPPAWLVSSIPGAAEAKAAWEAENAKGAELAREYSASGKALVALRNSDPLASELEAAERAYKAADKAVDAQAKRAVVALRRFDALVYGTADPAEFKAMAAQHALAKHEEAVAAWATLKAALTEREQAHGAAGSPGRDWRNSAPINYRSLANVETVVRPMLEAFDVAALKLTAEGERVPAAAEIAQAAIEAHKAADAKAVAAVRARSRKEGF
ncbi:hypothetical protein [Arthrobacter sp. EPSL27]|uniref:hypothetical protein n=1 Tax=Arthrobacter sp. EPSL27 TaxID=1745378 RepID=UPI000746D715|nr:hypothetical protein [Arthrobacter sp. EPSL27]KUM37704.1 hypothetical protein AR539_10840 [Arthrobacter sp. EPSL27]